MVVYSGWDSFLLKYGCEVFPAVFERKRKTSF